jgi:hypothetical protein
MRDCGCKPGTYEDGWQEQRSPACQRAESAAFARSIEAGYAWSRQHLLDVVVSHDESD